ncbi:MAG: winged helix-turn-helix domain-containing protein [Candidatus Bathyarchaeota archaeon]|nr:winged helix-turn-helix domain-containing protein [Candidatus Bathyarchaeota archaeon]
MGKNRGTLNLVADILEAARTGASKTRIMYRANLSFKLLKKYLDMTLRVGFIQPRGFKYELTAHGYVFLKRYRQFQEKYAQTRKLLKDLAAEQAFLEAQCRNGLNQNEPKSQRWEEKVHDQPSP